MINFLIVGNIIKADDVWNRINGTFFGLLKEILGAY